MQEDTDGFSHIFYQHQDLFEKQREVDDLVDDIAFNLGIGRTDLNIVRLTSQTLLSIAAYYSRSPLQRVYWPGP